jgi:hypothetical protein
MAQRKQWHTLVFGIAALASATTASATPVRSITYEGSALLQFQTSNGQPHPGALNGVYPVSARFYYDDSGVQLAASLFVAGVLREHFDFCPGWPGGYCPPLAVTATSIGSGTGTTPEDYISAGVFSPGGFGGLPLLTDRRRSYDLVAGDDGTISLSFALFDNASGFAWNSGSGAITRVITSVPEPSQWSLLLSGFALVGVAARRKRYNSPSAASRVRSRATPVK